MFDYAGISAVVANETDRAALLSGSSVALLLCALAGAMDARHQWSGSDEFGHLTDQEWNEIDALVAQAERELMSGLTGVFFQAVTQLPGSLPCDGGLYNRVDYPRLYDIWVGTSLIVDADHFRTPDARYKFILGADGSHAALSSGGEENHTLTLGEIPSHSHTYTAPIIGDLDFEDVGIPQPATAINPVPQNTGNAGSGQGHNNMPPYLVLGMFVWA